MDYLELKKYIDKEITKKEALKLFSLKGSEALLLFNIANEIRKKYCNDNFETCTISNIKFGNCSEDCKFCAQGTNCNQNFNFYSLKDKEIIIKEFKIAVQNKSTRFGLVASGKKMRKGTKEFKNLLDTIKEMVAFNKEVEICCSLGLLDREELIELKNSGVKRYHCNIQTSKEKYSTYAATTHSIDERLKTIKMAKKIGLKVCAGGIIGMGESFEDRIDMAFLLKKLDIDGIPINILNPIKGTPYENKKVLSPFEILKTIAIFRIILKNKNIKIAAGRENILKDFMGMTFISGSNGMMIGGYLTLRGRNVTEDLKFIENLKMFF